MDSIVLRLSEIEDAAQAILKDTETKKERLNQEFEERKDRYDQEQEALVNQRLSSIPLCNTDSKKNHRGIIYGKSTCIQWDCH